MMFYYTGGKWRMSEFIIKLFPPHKIYVELFGGSGAIIIRKKQTLVEVYNDINKKCVNFFRVLRDPDLCDQLIRKVEYTPYAREVYDFAQNRLNETTDPVTDAWIFIINNNLSHTLSGAIRKDKTGFFTCHGENSKSGHIYNWQNVPEEIKRIAKRMKQCIIENRDAIELIDIHDTENTLFYADPPYVDELCFHGSKIEYGAPFTNENHVQLLQKLNKIKGMAAISGYEHPIYSEILSNWKLYKSKSRNRHGDMRVECLWLNPKAVARINRNSLI